MPEKETNDSDGDRSTCAGQLGFLSSSSDRKSLLLVCSMNLLMPGGHSDAVVATVREALSVGCDGSWRGAFFSLALC